MNYDNCDHEFEDKLSGMLPMCEGGMFPIFTKRCIKCGYSPSGVELDPKSVAIGLIIFDIALFGFIAWAIYDHYMRWS